MSVAGRRATRECRATVPLSMGYLNAIWQRDASAMSLQSLAGPHRCRRNISTSPGRNCLASPGCTDFGTRLKKPVRFEGVESADALLSNAEKSYQLFGRPSIGADQVIAWIAGWVRRGGATLAQAHPLRGATGPLLDWQENANATWRLNEGETGRKSSAVLKRWRGDPSTSAALNAERALDERRQRA